MDKTLKEIQFGALEVYCGWNGKDKEYVVDGIVYDEDAAICAGEIVDKCKELKTLTDEFNQYGKSF